MVYPVKTDIIAILRHLAESIGVFARSNFVDLFFESEVDRWEIACQPDQIIPDVTHLLCRIITFTPSNYEVRLSVRQSKTPEGKTLLLCVVNTGAKLNIIKEITTGLQHPVEVTPAGDASTQFEWRLAIEPDEESERENVSPANREGKQYNLPVFF